jgi:hypothetical protein
VTGTRSPVISSDFSSIGINWPESAALLTTSAAVITIPFPVAESIGETIAWAL